jgi:DNA-binding MarR family transcriptional regulator
MESRQRPDGHLNAILDSLRRITQAIRLSSSVVQDTLGITGAQLFVLQALAEAPGASLRAIADRTLTDQSSVSVVVSRLVEGGQVTRRISAADARRTELSLTAAGRALLRRAPRLAQTRLVAALRAVPVSELRVTARVLVGVAGTLGPANEPAPMFFEPAAGARAAGRHRTRPRSQAALRGHPGKQAVRRPMQRPAKAARARVP